MQERNLENLCRLGGFATHFPFCHYTSGEIGNYFVQSIAIEKEGEAYAQAIRDMVQYFRLAIPTNSIDAIAGGETRDWDFSNPIASRVELPHMKLYKNKGPLGFTDVDGKVILPIADLNNEGSSFAKYWYPQITEAGGIVKDVMFFFDRMEGGHKVIENMGVNRHSLINLDEVAWKYLLDKEIIEDGVYRSARDRLENKALWAKKVLLTAEGIDRLRLNLESGPNRGKALGTVNYAPYQEFMDEVKDNLEKIGYSRGFE